MTDDRNGDDAAVRILTARPDPRLDASSKLHPCHSKMNWYASALRMVPTADRHKSCTAGVGTTEAWWLSAAHGNQPLEYWVEKAA